MPGTWNKARAEERRAAGLCVDCPDPASPSEPGKVRCRKCLDRAAAYGRRAWYRRQKPKKYSADPKLWLRSEIRRMSRLQPTEKHAGTQSAMWEKHAVLAMYHARGLEIEKLKKEIARLKADLQDAEKELAGG